MQPIGSVGIVHEICYIAIKGKTRKTRKMAFFLREIHEENISQTRRPHSEYDIFHHEAHFFSLSPVSLTYS
jgi:hypothetical protein